MLGSADAQKAIRAAIQDAAVKGRTALDVVREQAPDNLQLHATARQHLLGTQRPDALLRSPQASSIAAALMKRLQSAPQSGAHLTTAAAPPPAVKQAALRHVPKLLAGVGRNLVTAPVNAFLETAGREFDDRSRKLELRTALKDPIRALMDSPQRTDLETIGRVLGVPVTDDATRYRNLAATRGDQGAREYVDRLMQVASERGHPSQRFAQRLIAGREQYDDIRARAEAERDGPSRTPNVLGQVKERMSDQRRQGAGTLTPEILGRDYGATQLQGPLRPGEQPTFEVPVAGHPPVYAQIVGRDARNAFDPDSRFATVNSPRALHHEVFGHGTTPYIAPRLPLPSAVTEATGIKHLTYAPPVLRFANELAAQAAAEDEAERRGAGVTAAEAAGKRALDEYTAPLSSYAVSMVPSPIRAIGAHIGDAAARSLGGALPNYMHAQLDLLDKGLEQRQRAADLINRVKSRAGALLGRKS